MGGQQLFVKKEAAEVRGIEQQQAHRGQCQPGKPVRGYLEAEVLPPEAGVSIPVFGVSVLAPVPGPCAAGIRLYMY